MTLRDYIIFDIARGEGDSIIEISASRCLEFGGDASIVRFARAYKYYSHRIVIRETVSPSGYFLGVCRGCCSCSCT